MASYQSSYFLSGTSQGYPARRSSHLFHLVLSRPCRPIVHAPSGKGRVTERFRLESFACSKVVAAYGGCSELNISFGCVPIQLISHICRRVVLHSPRSSAGFMFSDLLCCGTMIGWYFRGSVIADTSCDTLHLLLNTCICTRARRLSDVAPSIWSKTSNFGCDGLTGYY